MKVLLSCARAGDRFSQPAGTIVEIEDAEARRVIASGQGQQVPDQMTVAPAETAMQSRGRPRQRG